MVLIVERMRTDLFAEVAAVAVELAVGERLFAAHRLARDATLRSAHPPAVLHRRHLHVVPVRPERAEYAAVVRHVAIEVGGALPDAHGREVRRLQRGDVPLVDAVVGNAVETDPAVRPRLHAGPFDAVAEVPRLARREMVDEAGRSARAARIHAHADVTVRHPLFRIDNLPVLVAVGRTVGDVRMLGDHALPRARIAVLEREAFGVRTVAQQHRVTAGRGGRENVRREDDPVVHRNRHIPVDAHAAARRRAHGFFLRKATRVGRSVLALRFVLVIAPYLTPWSCTCQRKYQVIPQTMEVALKIGIAGVGRMGAAIAARLIACGHSVSVWNRTPQKAQALSSAGATACATARALAGASDVVITILTDADAIDATYRGTEGLLGGDVRGKLFIDMSTVRTEVEKALAASVSAKGAALVECPVGGTVGPAKQGKLFGFVGGSAADVERARPVLAELCRRIEHVGPVGAGASVKLAINLPLLVYYQALDEALSLCDGVGVDPQRLIDIFADTSGGPNMLKVRGPAIAATLQGGETTPVTFDVDLIRKDLRTMLEEAAALGVRLPLVALALERYDEAAKNGFGPKDATMLPSYWLKHGRA